MIQFINLIKGILIGLALVIPGLSGSMFAVVVGLYDKILFHVNNIRKDFKKAMIFLIPVGVGCGVGILASAKLILYVCENYTFQSYAFFIGLVIGAMPMVYRKMKPGIKNPVNFVIAVLSFAVISFMSYLSVSQSNESYVAIQSIQNAGDFVTVFLAGVISCFLMAVPGVSGSVMLMLLNQYGTVYGAVSNVGEALVMLLKGDPNAVAYGLSALFVVLPFFIGAIAGFLAAAKIISYLIRKYEVNVYFGVFGLVIGAIVTLYNSGVGAGLSEHFSRGAGAGVVGIVLTVIFIVIGFICTYFLDSDEKKDGGK